MKTFLRTLVRIKTPRRNSRAYREATEAARALVHARIVELNAPYGFQYARIFIRNQKTRWGTCSKKGNLSFNYRIIYLPPRIADYLIVHELCHLQQFNHSKDFWALVAQTFPDYKDLRKALRAGYRF